MTAKTTGERRNTSLTGVEVIVLRPAGELAAGEAGWIAEVRGEADRRAWGETRVEALRAIRPQLARKGVVIDDPAPGHQDRSFSSILYRIGLEAGTLSRRG